MLLTPRMIGLVLVLGLGATGCAAWMSTSTEAGIDSGRRPSVDERVDLGMALGADSKRGYLAAGLAAGYSARHDANYVSLSEELGYEGGGPVRLAAGFRADIVFSTLGEDATAYSAGPNARLAIRVLHPRDGDDLYVGPTLAAQLVDDPLASAVTFKASAGFAFRWVFSDFTEDRRFRLARSTRPRTRL